MQRSKIKVGFDYALSSYRDWWTYGFTSAQVLDVGHWHHLSHWDKEGMAAAPDTVHEPHRPSRETIEVPGQIRRGDGRMTRNRNLVLIRPFTEEDGVRKYGKPYTAATRDLVAPLAEAQQRRAEYQEETRKAARAARIERERRQAQEEQFNERLAKWGVGPVGRSHYAGDRFVLDAAALETLLTLAERWRDHAAPANEPEPPAA